MKNFQDIWDEILSLDPQNPGTWPRYVHIGASVLGFIVVAVLGAYLLIKPEMETLEQERGKESGLFSEFEQKQRKVAALDAYKAQLVEMEKSFGDMLRQLPGKAEVANLLNEISQTRVASSLEEELFKPEGDIPKDFYVELPNQIIVIGTYHEMGNFVSGVSALPRIVTIDDVDIRPLAVKGAGAKADPNSSDGGVLLRMQALAKTYRYLDADEVAAQEEAKSKEKGGAGKPRSGASK